MGGLETRDGLVIGLMLIIFGLLVTLKIIPWEWAPVAGLVVLALIGLYVWLARRNAFTGLGLTAAGSGGIWWLLRF